MILTIDDVQKTVEVEGEVSLYELFDTLTRMKISLKEYSLVSGKTVEYIPYNPQITSPSPSYPYSPWTVVSVSI